MGNPFKELKAQKQVQNIMEAGWEEVDGPMQCQTPGCHRVANTGMYNAEALVLTWKCSEGHISRMENIEA